jgi:hypothetical protein
MKAALSLAALAVSAAAFIPAPAGAETEKVHKFVVYGKDPCPRAQSDDEIVVCARRPDTERYRIPKELRDSAVEEDPDSTSWTDRSEALEYVGRGGIQSCSTVGPGGASGCWNEMVRAWRRDRRTGDGEPGR